MGEKELYNQTPSILITLLELVMMSYVDFFPSSGHNYSLWSDNQVDGRSLGLGDRIKISLFSLLSLS